MKAAPQATETASQQVEAGVPEDALGAAQIAIRKSLPFLEEQGLAWMEGRVPIQDGSPCVSCHHVGYSLWSQKEARRAGILGTDQVLETLSATAVEFLSKPGTPRAFSASSTLLGAARSSEGLVQALLDLQTKKGSWQAKGQFPSQRRPLPESDAVATLWTLHALGSESGEETFATAQGRAAAWLDQEEAGKSTEWLAARIVVAGAADAEELEGDLLAALLARQNQDGGWGWLGDDASEAFSTGQALYALAFVPLPDRAPLQRAVDFLLETQRDDGTWEVPASAVSREPSASKDVIYRFWGTAWATIGLSRSIRSP